MPGWWIAGVKGPETIAEHSFRVAGIGAVLAMMEGADPAKVTLLCTFHDTQETRVGGIPWTGRRYLTAAKNEGVTRDQLADAQPAVAGGVQAVVDEYEHGDSLEVLIAHDADKLECKIQGLEYLEHRATATPANGATAHAQNLRPPQRPNSPVPRRAEHVVSRVATDVPTITGCSGNGRRAAHAVPTAPRLTERGLKPPGPEGDRGTT